MISKKTLKEYEYKSIEDYFNYIIDSKINGNYSQVKSLIKDLSKDQKILLFNKNNLFFLIHHKYQKILLFNYLKNPMYEGIKEDIGYIEENLI